MPPQQPLRRKNSMSWLDLSIWLDEQKDLIVYSYIDNLYYIKESQSLILKLYNSRKDSRFWLILEPSKRISTLAAEIKVDNIIDEKSQKIWRAHLKGCLVTELSQIPCERIVYIHLSCRHKIKKLVVELLPRGVVCVLDEQDNILLCSEYRDMKDRAIRLSQKYNAPPSIGVCSNITKSLHLIREKPADVISILIRDLGIPPEIAEAIAIQCKIIGKKGLELSDSDILCVDNSYRSLVIERNGYRPCIVLDAQGIPIGFYPYSLPQFSNLRIEFTPSFNEAINRYFEEDFKRMLLSISSRVVSRDIERLKHSIESIDELITKLKNELEFVKTKIDKIENNYVDLELLHQCVIDRVKTQGWSSINSCGYIVEAIPTKGIYKTKIDDLIIELDVRKTLVEIYNELKKTEADMRKSIARAQEEKEKLIKKLKALTEEIEAKERILSTKLSRRKEWYESYIWYITSSGLLVIGGKDASQNIKIVRKLLEPHDILMHADIHGASTIVIKTHGKPIDDNSIKEAAVIAASYSKAWKLKLMSIDVFWVYGSQISLSPPSGQYLPKGSYMVYGERNYVRNVELRLAVGLEIKEGNARVIIGPEDVVDKRSIAYIVIVPGDLDPRSVSLQFIEFLKSKNLADLASILDVDDIAKIIPGKSDIIKKVVRPFTG